MRSHRREHQWYILPCVFLVVVVLHPEFFATSQAFLEDFYRLMVLLLRSSLTCSLCSSSAWVLLVVEMLLRMSESCLKFKDF